MTDRHQTAPQKHRFDHRVGLSSSLLCPLCLGFSSGYSGFLSQCKNKRSTRVQPEMNESGRVVSGRRSGGRSKHGAEINNTAHHRLPRTTTRAAITRSLHVYMFHILLCSILWGSFPGRRANYRWQNDTIPHG